MSWQIGWWTLENISHDDKVNLDQKEVDKDDVRMERNDNECFSPMTISRKSWCLAIKIKEVLMSKRFQKIKSSIFGEFFLMTWRSPVVSDVFLPYCSEFRFPASKIRVQRLFLGFNFNWEFVKFWIFIIEFWRFVKLLEFAKFTFAPRILKL